MAKEGAMDELLAEVISRYDNSPNPRLKEVTTAAIRHLHAFAREVNLTREEWFAGIMFLTACGKISDDVRQEFILLSDTTGVSTLVEMLAYDASASSLTDNTVLGRTGTPEDIAEAVLYMTKAPWLTGEVLDINGGAHMLRYPDVMGALQKLMGTA